MARIVLGIGTSHTPLFTLDSSEWKHRAEADYANPKLNLSDGRLLTYPELLGEVGPRYAEVARPEELQRKAALCEAALDRLTRTWTWPALRVSTKTPGLVWATLSDLWPTGCSVNAPSRLFLFC